MIESAVLGDKREGWEKDKHNPEEKWTLLSLFNLLRVGP